MEKRLSRKKERLNIVLTGAVIALGLMGQLIDSPVFAVLFCVVLVIWAFCVIDNRRCPYCGKMGRYGLRWSAPDAGYCRHCGKLLKYDDAE